MSHSVSRHLALATVKALSVATDPLLGGRRKGPRILIYHQVGASSGLEMDLGSETFAWQVEWLRSNWEVVALGDALEGPDLPDFGKRVVLTFDDGHHSVFDHAFPVLRELGVPFTLYLSTHPIEAGGSLHDDPAMPLLGWGQVAEMMASGLMTLGAHSHRHLDMRSHSAVEIAGDLETCDRVLAQRVGVEPRHFAYPWGHWSEAADAVVRERYQTAVLGSGPGIRPGADPHTLSRIPVMAGDGRLLFKRKLWGGFRLESGLRRLRDSIRQRR